MEISGSGSEKSGITIGDLIQIVASGTSHNYLPIKLVFFSVILRYSSVREHRLSFFFMPCLTKK